MKPKSNGNAIPSGNEVASSKQSQSGTSVFEHFDHDANIAAIFVVSRSIRKNLMSSDISHDRLSEQAISALHVDRDSGVAAI